MRDTRPLRFNYSEKCASGMEFQFRYRFICRNHLTGRCSRILRTEHPAYGYSGLAGAAPRLVRREAYLYPIDSSCTGEETTTDT